MTNSQTKDIIGRTDDQILILRSPIPPSVNHYLALRCVIKNGKPLALSYKTKDAVQFQEDFGKYVAAEVAKQGWVMDKEGTKHIYADAYFTFPRTDMDSNNYWKCMLDAITDTGLVWIDDNIVCERTQRIQYDSEDPHVRLEIHYADYVGIFDGEHGLSRFEDKCKTCSRYKNNCSLLNKARSGKVQKEIKLVEDSEYECDKYKVKKELKDYGKD